MYLQNTQIPSLRSITTLSGKKRLVAVSVTKPSGTDYLKDTGSNISNNTPTSEKGNTSCNFTFALSQWLAKLRLTEAHPSP